MALADRLAEPKPAALAGSPCSVGALLDVLNGAERDALLVMLGTPEQRGWTAGAIYDALMAEGHTVGFQTINRHRARRCRCYRDAA